MKLYASVFILVILSFYSTGIVYAQAPEFVVVADDGTNTIKGNAGDTVTLTLYGVPQGAYQGGAKLQLTDPTAGELKSGEESHDFFYNGIMLWWTPTSADPGRGGAGSLYYYTHEHNGQNLPTADDYLSAGTVEAASWVFEGQAYGYTPGPSCSIDNTDTSLRFYYNGNLGFSGPGNPNQTPGVTIHGLG